MIQRKSLFVRREVLQPLEYRHLSHFGFVELNLPCGSVAASLPSLICHVPIITPYVVLTRQGLQRTRTSDLNER